MNYPETLAWIHGTERFGSRLGLGRMGRLLHRMGDPHLKVPYIHVAGTNGKGSTTTMIASALTAGGFKTGKFISPFILEFRERMQIDSEMIPEETLAALATRLRPIAEEFKAAGDPPTEFELVTVLGLTWFAEAGCDIAVLEVGLGGRLDATNIIPPPLVAVITRIDYDHTAILGDTLAAIAGEKCGILKRGSTVICYPDQEEEALAVIRRRAAEEGDPLCVQCPADLFQTVAVGGRLHHGHVIFPFVRLLDDVQVVADGPEVDFGPGAGRAGGWHGGERRLVERKAGANAPNAKDCPSLRA